MKRWAAPCAFAHLDEFTCCSISAGTSFRMINLVFWGGRCSSPTLLAAEWLGVKAHPGQRGWHEYVGVPLIRRSGQILPGTEHPHEYLENEEVWSSRSYLSPSSGVYHTPGVGPNLLEDPLLSNCYRISQTDVSDSPCLINPSCSCEGVNKNSLWKSDASRKVVKDQPAWPPSRALRCFPTPSNQNQPREQRWLTQTH